jgi:hypothetical protein
LEARETLVAGDAMLKKILIGLVLVIALSGVGGYFLYANMDSVVRSTIEKYGTAATQATVRLDHVKITLATGEAALGGLSVGSPTGFAADKSLYLGDIAVKLDTGSLAGNGPIVIQDITIEKPQVTYEVNNTGESNLQTIARNAEAYAASIAGGGEKGNASDAGAKQPGRKLIIDSLTVRDGQIAISQAMLQGRQLSAPLPVIHLTNIGKGEGGATPAEVAEKVLAAITNSASQIASADLAKELGSTLEKTGGGIVNGAAGGIGGQIKGLLGK